MGKRAFGYLTIGLLVFSTTGCVSADADAPPVEPAEVFAASKEQPFENCDNFVWKSRLDRSRYAICEAGLDEGQKYELKWSSDPVWEIKIWHLKPPERVYVKWELQAVDTDFIDPFRGQALSWGFDDPLVLEFRNRWGFTVFAEYVDMVDDGTSMPVYIDVYKDGVKVCSDKGSFAKCNVRS